MNFFLINKNEAIAVLTFNQQEEGDRRDFIKENIEFFSVN